MTFKEMQDELVNFRFGEGKRTNAKFWINHRYRQLFVLRDWSFRQISREAVTIHNTGLLSTTTYPVARIYSLELGSTGDSLAAVSPKDFRGYYSVTDTAAGTPQEYTTIGGRVQVRPVPTGDITAYASYQMAPVVNQVGGVPTAGGLVNDTDYPFFADTHHYTVVLGAMATGLKVVNDPTWEALEQEYGLGVDLMIDDYSPPDQYGTSQFGREDWN